MCYELASLMFGLRVQMFFFGAWQPTLRQLFGGLKIRLK